MGSYDTVVVNCPKCKHILKLQSKAGDCDCMEYTLKTAPLSIIADISRDTVKCSDCGVLFTFKVDYRVYKVKKQPEEVL